MTATVVHIKGALSALVNLEPIDGRVSWLGPQARGVEPYNLYFFDFENRLLLIDTGVAAHGDDLLRMLHERIEGRTLCVFLTRSELEAIGNLRRILCEFPNVQILTSCPLKPMELIHEMGIPHRHPPSKLLPFDVTLEADGLPSFRTVRPVIKTLGTGWLFEKETQTLFTTDLFSADLMESATDTPIRTSRDPFPSQDMLRETTIAKFAWFEFAEPGEFAAAWRACFSVQPISILAPSHGRIQAGADLVPFVIDQYRRALRIPAREGAGDRSVGGI
jgi:flavorubredoxin